MTAGAKTPLCYRLPRLYWPYQLLFGAAQLLSALVVTAWLACGPAGTWALLALLPPLLAAVSLGVHGPVEKIGLVIEAERLLVAGRSIPFAEILQVAHDYSWQREDGEAGPHIDHVWKLRLRLLADRELTVFEHRCLRPERDPRPPPHDSRGREMALAIRRAHALWACSHTPSQLRHLRKDLRQFRKYEPGDTPWRDAVASQGFSLAALGVAALASICFAAWLK